MTWAYYPLTATIGDTFIADLKNALEDYYANLTVYNHGGGNTGLFFSCPGISNKVIRFYRGAGNTYSLVGIYGDSWVSGTSMTNTVTFESLNSSVIWHNAGCLLKEDVMIIFTHSTKGQIIIIGKMTNGEYIILGETTKNTTTGENLVPITFPVKFVDPAGRLFRQQVYFVKNGSELLMAGSSPVTIPGVYNISHSAGSSFILDANMLISSSSRSFNGIPMNTSFLVYR